MGPPAPGYASPPGYPGSGPGSQGYRPGFGYPAPGSGPGSGYGPGYGPAYAYPPGFSGWGGPPPWKGAKLGRPSNGPGALAEPAKRLAARLLDGLIFTPFVFVLGAIVLLIAAPHFGPLFPASTSDTGPAPFPGFLWLELTLVAVTLFSQVVYLFYDAFCTVRWGRTPGKAILHLRPVKVDGRPLGWGSALGRAGATAAAGFLSWLGLIDPLWCLWDENRQCLHDKIVSTIVVQD
ncbi:MAG: RDD family protein [Actinomycetota bacterium]|nr:RDD family protein [Actinomycetota bacterium]